MLRKVMARGTPNAGLRVEGDSIARNHEGSLLLGSFGSHDPRSGVCAVLLDQLVLVAATPPGAHHEHTVVERCVERCDDSAPVGDGVRCDFFGLEALTKKRSRKTPSVASRNRSQRFLATNAASVGPIGPKTALQPPPRNGFEFVSVVYGGRHRLRVLLPVRLGERVGSGAALALLSALREA
jgi:hypothetical protein